MKKETREKAISIDAKPLAVRKDDLSGAGPVGPLKKAAITDAAYDACWHRERQGELSEVRWRTMRSR